MMRAWWVGNDDSELFGAVIRQLAQGGWLHCFATPQGALEQIDRHAHGCGQMPHVIVISRLVPTEFPRELLEAARQALPLTPRICVFGPWCVGMLRRKQLWPATIHLCWRTAASWLSLQYQRAHAGQAPAWSYPAYRQGDWLPGDGTA